MVMVRDVLTACALLVSVTGIGVSLAREEMRCYLGLQSTECSKSEVKVLSPKSSSDQETSPTTEISSPNSDFESRNNIKTLTKTPKPLFSEQEPSPNYNNPEISQPNMINSSPSVDEISRGETLQVPSFGESSHSKNEQTVPNNSPLFTEEEPEGIPIKVEPFQESE